MHGFWQAVAHSFHRTSRFVKRLRLRAVGVGVWLGLLYLPAQAGAAAECGALQFGCMAAQMGKAAISGLIGTIVLGLAVIVRLFAEFCAMIISLTLPIFKIFIEGSNAVTKNEQISDLWKIMRDFSNALLIIVLLVGAVMVILQRANYTVKTLLPKLALAVLLVNFSKMMIQLMLDAFHVVSVGIYQFASPNGEITEVNAVPKMIELLNVNDIIMSITNNPEAKGDALKNGMLLIGTLFVAALIVYICFSTISLLILYVERYFGLALLLIFSPLALIFGILPVAAFKTMHESFWKKLISYASMSVIVSAHLALAMIISESFLSVDVNKIESSTISGQKTGALGQFPGGPDVDWMTLVNVILVGVIVKSAVNAAKNDKLGFAAAAVDTVQKKGEEWAQKTITRAPIMPTLERDADGNYRPKMRSMKQIGSGLQDVGKHVMGRMDEREKRSQAAFTENLMRMGEKNIPFTNTSMVKKGTSEGMRASARAEREKAPLEEIKNIASGPELRKYIEGIDATTSEGIMKIRLLTEHQAELIGKMNDTDSHMLGKQVTIADATLQKQGGGEEVNLTRRKLAQNMGNLGKVNGHLAFKSVRTPDAPDEGMLINPIDPTTGAAQEKIPIDYVSQFNESKYEDIIKMYKKQPGDLKKIVDARRFTDSQMRTMANNAANIQRDEPELYDALKANGFIVEHTTAGMPTTYTANPNYRQNTTSVDKLIP